ncbi:MAG: Fe-S cluster assembly protein SufD [Acidobacteria bacterium]|nr:Fe-S cluster assembly protein SufD [Acidobacteriota bacterium]
MTAVKDYQGTYLAQFQAHEKDHAAGPGWLAEVRRAAIHRFAELGFPTTKDEEWKYTNVAPIAQVPFQPVAAASATATAESLAWSCFFELDCPRLVFVNGHYSPGISFLAGLPKGVTATRLAKAVSAGTPALEQHLARYADLQNSAFTALNTALMQDGGFIEIPRGAVVEKPIYLLYVSTGDGGPTISSPRTLILAGRECQATVIEGHIGFGEGTYFSNAVTEIVADENAVIEYSKLHQESRTASHVGTVRVEQARSSNVTTHSFSFGGALIREDLNAVLNGEGAEAQLNGLYLMTARQHIDHHTTLDHAQPHCASRELYKGVLDGQAAGVFNGRVIVRKDAQKTDSKQSNKNLLLSEEAVINTKPQLEIFADDVKCTHGATIGQVDQEAIFYLRSRGIGISEARKILTFAFANDIIDRVKFAPLRDRLRDALFQSLAKRSRKEPA